MSPERLAALVAEHDEGFSGVLLVRRGEETLFSGAWGLANRAWGVPNAPDTRFRVASVGKMFTAVAVLRLVERGQIGLETPVGPLLGLDRGGVPPEVTVRHLLTMSAGIADWFEESDGPDGDTWEALAARTPLHTLRENRDYLPLFADRPPRARPGERHAYSNSSYILLGLILEQISGQPYAQHIAEQVFAPAGMVDSGLPGLDGVEARVAEGYALRDGVWKRNIYLCTPPAADGGATCTAPDLLRFLAAARAGRLLGPALTAALLRPQIADGDAPYRGCWWHYGYGAIFLTNEQGQVLRYGHTGEEEGASARLMAYPTLGLDVALLSNHSEGVSRLAWPLHDLILGG